MAAIHSPPIPMEIDFRGGVQDVVKFSSLLKSLIPQMGTVSELYKTTIENALQTSKENLSENKTLLIDSFFKEFSRNNFGHEGAGLQGTRGKILAMLEVPQSFHIYFEGHLREFIKGIIATRHWIELVGIGKKATPFFSETLFSVIKSGCENIHLLSLRISKFDLGEAEATQIIDGLQVQRIRSLNLSGNAFSDASKSALKEMAAGEPKIHLIL